VQQNLTNPLYYIGYKKYENLKLHSYKVKNDFTNPSQCISVIINQINQRKGPKCVTERS